MKLLFIPAQAKVDLSGIIPKIKVKGRVGLVAAVQYTHVLEELQKHPEHLHWKFLFYQNF